jgi:PIN domain.
MTNNTKITDIQSFTPINTNTEYFLDTNVLYWYTNPRVSTVKDLPRHAQIYYTFIDKLTAMGSPLTTSIYNLTELLNVIEKNEFDIYINLHPDENYINKKDYRRMTNERSRLQNIMKTTLNNVFSICKIVEFPFELKQINDFANTLKEHRCDVFDYMVLQNCVKNQTINIISDDNDFSTYNNIKLFTANTSSLPNI